jgi:hypothetical protein
MTMSLSNHGFFKAYIQSLSDKQLQALEEWNTARVAWDHEDAITKKRIIWKEQRRRNARDRG